MLFLCSILLVKWPIVRGEWGLIDFCRVFWFWLGGLHPGALVSAWLTRLSWLYTPRTGDSLSLLVASKALSLPFLKRFRPVLALAFSCSFTIHYISSVYLYFIFGSRFPCGSLDSLSLLCRSPHDSWKNEPGLHVYDRHKDWKVLVWSGSSRCDFHHLLN